MCSIDYRFKFPICVSTNLHINNIIKLLPNQNLFAIIVSMSVEALINKATDAALTADNWQYILEVCDVISTEPEESTKPAIKHIAQRLDSNDANVILRSLSLLVAVAENCGSRMRQEIASKKFLKDSVIKRLNDRKLHRTVKTRIVEVIEQLNDTFKGDPSLKPMSDAYEQVRSQYGQYFRNQVAPDKPSKKQRSEQDKIKEEEELQRALKMSLNEYEREQNMKSYLEKKPLPEIQDQKATDQVNENIQLAQQKTSEQTIATVSKVRALYDLISYEPDELSFRRGDVITVIESVYRDWWRGSMPDGKVGIFPLNYVTPIVNQSPEELIRDLNAEDKLLNQDLKKVDRLLLLLSSLNVNSLDEDEIALLYNDVIPLRPLLGKSIDKYSVRKEELMVLNSHLNSEFKVYNDLMDKLISQRSQGRQTQFDSHVALPYPSQIQNQSLPSFPSYSNQELQPQPTSSGFGNSQQSQGLGPEHAEYFQSQFPRQNDDNLQKFLNVNRFPAVNNMQ